jgi:CDP-glucose 4,6-dehydratase
MHYLITGHTGFKGAWLSLLLQSKGHQVSGIALDPTDASLFEVSQIGNRLTNDIRCDIRDYMNLEKHLKELNPDVIIHLAAQSLVRRSYRIPFETFEINVNGTLNVLKASEECSNLKSRLIITTDKVYKNVNKTSGYVEEDALGGFDPYSASKAMGDIATQSWSNSFQRIPTAIARAGNVIGGGDASEDRLFPDLIEDLVHARTPRLRFPNSIRPWQHVLDCLNGYLLLVDRMLKDGTSGAWNFGPRQEDVFSVGEVTEKVMVIWGMNPSWELVDQQLPYESSRLLLNSSKAYSQLGWEDRLSVEEAINWTTSWYKNVSKGANPLDETLTQIRLFQANA